MEVGSIHKSWKVLSCFGEQRVKCICTLCNKMIRYVDQKRLQVGDMNPCVCTINIVPINLGQKYNYFEVVQKGKSCHWICNCICGKKVEIKAAELRKGSILSCGCRKSESRERKRERTRQTSLERYGAEHYTKTPEFLEKIKQTSLKKYGVEHHTQTQECKEKIKKATLEKYGVEYYSKTPEYLEKIKQTSLERYGVEHYAQTQECKERAKQTSVERYGVENYTQTQECKEKMKQTNLKKYGVEYYSKSKERKERVRKTNLEKFGCENPFQADFIKEKIKKKNLEVYGVEHTSQSERTRQTKIEKNQMSVLSTGLSIATLCKQNEIPHTNGLKVYKTYGEEVFLEYVDKYEKNIFSTELAIIDILKDVFPKIAKYDKVPQEFKSRKRPDFRLELNNRILYLNIDGLYAHSAPAQKDNKYHFKLRESFEKNNSRIMQFREDELRKPEMIKSIVCNYFGLSTKIDAGKCEIKTVSSNASREFFDKNHLMGSSSAPTFGLYYENQLVCAITIKRKKDGLDVVRFCEALSIQVVGGLSRLLEYVKEIYKPNFIRSSVDLRYADGSSYEELNFKLESISLGWSWTNYKNTFNRLKCKANMDDRKLSQEDYTKELGWTKIYDAGQAKYLFK